MRIPDRVARLVLVIATTTGATYTIVVAGWFESLALRLVYDAMAAIALIPWLVLAVFRRDWRPSSRLIPAIIACLAAFAISSATSRVPRISVEMFGYAVLLAEVYLLLVALMRRPEIRVHFGRLALLLCVVVSGLYLWQVTEAWIDWFGLVGRITIPPLRPAYLGLSLGSPNPLATLVLMLGGFALAANRLRGRPGRVAAAFVVLLVALTTLITGSRGAWLGAAVGLVATAGVALLTQPEIRAHAREVARSRRGAIAVVVGIPVVVAAGALASLSGRLTVEDGGLRAGFARASLQMFQGSPLTGVGPGTWGVLRSSNTLQTDPDLYVPHAHSLYLQALAEFGLVGVVAAVVVARTLGVLMVRSIRSDDAIRRRVAYAALFAAVLLAVQQVTDMLVNVPALLLAVALPIAWLDATAAPGQGGMALDEQHRSTMRGRAVPLGAAVLTIAILVGLARIEAATSLARQGVALGNGGFWSEAAQLIGDAVNVDPGVNIYQFELGVSAANAGDLPRAEAALATSAMADDYTYAWLNLAAVRWQLGDMPGAREALARAERLGLQRTPVAVASAWLHQQLGDDESAIDNYVTAVLQTPTLVDDPFWSSPSAPSEALAAILQAVDQRAAPATILQIDLILGRYDRAQAQISGFGGSEPELYTHLIPAWRGDTAAWAELQAVAARRPLDPVLVRWCRLVAAHLGDEASIERYRGWQVILGTWDSGLPTVGRIVLGSAQDLPAYSFERYGSSYRRDVLAAQVVSILPQIVWQDRP